MGIDEKLQTLRGVPLFSRLGRREIERLGMLTDEVDLPAGRTLMRQGERGEELFVIVNGEASVEIDGREIRRASAGEFFGEIALIDGGPRTATVSLTQDSRLLVIGRTQFRQVMDELPDLRLQLLEALAERVRNAEPHAAH